MKSQEKILIALGTMGLFFVLVFLIVLNRATPPSASVDLPVSKYGSFLAGYHAKHLSDFDTAAKYYESILKESQNKKIIKNVYLLNVFSGNLAATEKYADLYAKEYKGQTISSFIKMTQIIKAEEYKKAFSELKKMEKEKKNQPLITLVKAWLYAADGHYKKANQTLRGLKKSNLTDLYYVHQFYIAAFMNQTKDALKTAGILKSKPISLRIIKDVCAYYIQNDDHKSAVEFAEKTIHTKNSYSGKQLLRWVKKTKKVTQPIIENPKQGVAEAFTDFNLMILNPATWELSLVISQLALELDPSIVIAKLIQAELLEQQRQYRRANDVYRTIGTDEYIYPSVKLKMAKNLYEMGEKKEAIKLYKKNIKRYPDYDQPQLILAKEYLVNRSYKKALKLYDNVIEHYGQAGEKGDWKTYYYRALVNDRLQQYDRVEDDLQTALELSNNNAVVLNYLGYFWIEQDREHDKALKMIEAALMKHPESDFWDSLGWAFFKLGKKKEALRFLELAVQKDAANPTAHEHLGDVYFDLGRTREAGYQWERALLYKDEGLGLKDPDGLQDKLDQFNKK